MIVGTASASVQTPAAPAQDFRAVRAETLRLCLPLSAEDMAVQPAPEASPAKWHLAHTTWFFDTFILSEHQRNYRPYNPAFRSLFNSYYTAVGERHPRAARGVLTRPGLGEIMAYRDVVDEQILELLDTVRGDRALELARLVQLGLNHEQQHQELLLTDIKLLLSMNPLDPPYDDSVPPDATAPAPEMEWVEFAGGVVEIGMDAASPAFHYDNESPRHRRFLEPFALGSRLVTCGEFIRFIDDGGYQQPALWLDEGWQAVERQAWSGPQYWRREANGQWTEFTLHGRRPVEPARPVAHISFFEADAYARWAGARLPTECEWEHAADSAWDDAVACGRMLDSKALLPGPAGAGAPGLQQLAGDVWEWTRSAHEPYPGYTAPPGALGEYNGKFMCGTFVLRGGSLATPRDHIRRTYRNFFHPAARWQFTGLRLARSIPSSPGQSKGAL